MESVWCLIVGSGFAGASTAYHLGRRGGKKVLLLEQEAELGVHSSGRNAGMVRQLIADPTVAAMARRGAKGLDEFGREVGNPTLLRRRGSLLFGGGAAWDRLARAAEDARDAGLGVEVWSREDAVRRVPVLEGAAVKSAIFTEDDGVVEVGSLLGGYLSRARDLGVSIRHGCRVRGIRKNDLGGFVLESEDAKIWAEILVDAGGAWAEQIGKMAGSRVCGLRPTRRHLFFTGPLAWVDPSWPFVWDVAAGLYFRPESGGLLLSPCDEDEHPPGLPLVRDEAALVLARKIDERVPRLRDLPIARKWAGLRTLTPDGRFVIGWDPEVAGLFWVAGLGGHGVTCSYAVGELAADGILSPRTRAAGPHDPSRLVGASPLA